MYKSKVLIEISKRLLFASIKPVKLVGKELEN
jgi:hypothetical protein